jgi:hypothetical protein
MMMLGREIGLPAELMFGSPEKNRTDRKGPIRRGITNRY